MLTTHAFSNQQAMEPAAKKRRTSGAVRQENVAKGAVLLMINFAHLVAGKVFSLFGGSKDDLTNRQTEYEGCSGSDRDKRERVYRTMERKGFRVTSDIGCLIPHDHYCTFAKGSTAKGYQRAFFAWQGFVPAQGKDAPRDEAGRDISPQLSHLCHRRSCCRLDHIAYEPKWRNFMRNWCLGPLSFTTPDGRLLQTCGCSVQFYLVPGMDKYAGPPCLRVYEVSPESPPDHIEVCEGFEAAAQRLRETSFPFTFALACYTEREQVSNLRQQKKQKKSAVRADVKALSPDAKRFVKRHPDKDVLFAEEVTPPKLKGQGDKLVVAPFDAELDAF